MHFTPRRRRRMLRAHALREAGYSLREIARLLGVSVSTVHADLRALETHWPEFAHACHDDLLLQQIARTNQRLERLHNQQPTELISQLGLPSDILVTVADMTRLQALREQSINAASRELRMLLAQLGPAARQRAGEIIELELLDLPDDQLADPEQDRTLPNTTERSAAQIPSKTREIGAQRPSEKNSAEHPNAPPHAHSNGALPKPEQPPLPRHTGRNKPCPCGSGKKRKHCCPQQPRGSPPTYASERERLIQVFEQADQANDQLTALRALEQLYKLEDALTLEQPPATASSSTAAG